MQGYVPVTQPGKLKVSVLDGIDLEGHALYCILELGSQRHRTVTVKGAGPKVEWNDRHEFRVGMTPELTILVKSEYNVSFDNELGTAVVSILKAIQQGKHQVDVTLYDHTNTPRGLITVLMEFEAAAKPKPAVVPIARNLSSESLDDPSLDSSYSYDERWELASNGAPRPPLPRHSLSRSSSMEKERRRRKPPRTSGSNPASPTSVRSSRSSKSNRSQRSSESMHSSSSNRSDGLPPRSAFTPSHEQSNPTQSSAHNAAEPRNPFGPIRTAFPKRKSTKPETSLPIKSEKPTKPKTAASVKGGSIQGSEKRFLIRARSEKEFPIRAGSEKGFRIRAGSENGFPIWAGSERPFPSGAGSEKGFSIKAGSERAVPSRTTAQMRAAAPTILGVSTPRVAPVAVKVPFGSSTPRAFMADNRATFKPPTSSSALRAVPDVPFNMPPRTPPHISSSGNTSGHARSSTGVKAVPRSPSVQSLTPPPPSTPPRAGASSTHPTTPPFQAGSSTHTSTTPSKFGVKDEMRLRARRSSRGSGMDTAAAVMTPDANSKASSKSGHGFALPRVPPRSRTTLHMGKAAGILAVETPNGGGSVRGNPISTATAWARPVWR